MSFSRLAITSPKSVSTATAGDPAGPVVLVLVLSYSVRHYSIRKFQNPSIDYEFTAYTTDILSQPQSRL